MWRDRRIDEQLNKGRLLRKIRSSGNREVFSDRWSKSTM
jgi:hypothetical protein